MASGYCRECGSKVVTSAKFCPHCGVGAPTASDPLAALGLARRTIKQPTAIVYRRSKSEGILSGLLACVFAVLGIFTLGIIFVPLAALCSLIGLLLALAGRSSSGFLVSLLGGALTAVGFIMSPSLWFLAGGLLVASQVDEHGAASKAETIKTLPATKPSAAVLTSPTSTPLPSVRVTEPYEGLWAQTKAHCLDDDGPNSRTLIDLGNVVDGKLVPIFDQYENHCRIDQKSKSANVTTLAVTCYEFWEYFSANKEGSPGAIMISLDQKGKLLRIDGKSYQLCKTLASLNAKQ